MLDEAERIADQLEHVTGLDGIDEVIVADGGSSDDTVGLARAATGVRVVASLQANRAAGMNAGAAAASGDVFLFVHADVTLPTSAAKHVREAMARPEVVAGAFRTHTRAEPDGLPLGPLLRLADVRSRYTSLPYGDQAMFVRADVFRRLGGFPELPLMEDLEMSRRLRRVGEIVRVPTDVVVSGRRFQQRPVFYTALVNIYPLLYRMGVPARVLARFYRDVR